MSCGESAADGRTRRRAGSLWSRGWAFDLAARYRKLIWFGIVGVTANLTYLGLMWLMIGRVGVGDNAAILTSLAFAGAISYLGHFHLTFRVSGTHRARVVKFGLQMLLSYMVSIGALHAARAYGINYLVAVLFVQVFVPVMNFVIMQFWVFAVHPAQTRPEARTGDESAALSGAPLSIPRPEPAFAKTAAERP